MLAVYPGEGARFARHIDNTTSDGRRLTVLVYLNPDWDRARDQGALRLTPGQETVDVFPEAGRLAMFYSADVPHEVMPTFGQRHAVTVWYYDTEERLVALQDAQQSGRAEAVGSSSLEHQVEAKQFIGHLMGGDEVGVDGGATTPEELADLQKRAAALSDEAVVIVSSITGAPSPSSFREGFTLLQTDDVKSMRALFRRMGLD
jgi:hypoxia-inducible factor prolyl hydroxylase